MGGEKMKVEMKAFVSVHLKNLRIRRENYNNCRRHHVRFAVFVGFWKDYLYITFDLKIFAQAKQNQIFTRQNLLQTQELSYYVFH